MWLQLRPEQLIPVRQVSPNLVEHPPHRWHLLDCKWIHNPSYQVSKSILIKDHSEVSEEKEVSLFGLFQNYDQPSPPHLPASFDLQWPSLVEDFFDSTEPAANVGDRIISIDCFMDSSGSCVWYSGFTTIPRPYVYLLIYLFLPLLIILLSLVFWRLAKRRNRSATCNRTVTTTIILLFLVHPTITTLLIRVFK